MERNGKEKGKNIMIKELKFLKVDIYLEKGMEMEKNIMIMVY